MLKRDHVFYGAIHLEPVNREKKKIVINFDTTKSKSCNAFVTKYTHLIGLKQEDDVANIGMDVHPFLATDFVKARTDWLCQSFFHEFGIHESLTPKLLSTAITYFLREDFDIALPLLANAVQDGKIIIYTNNDTSKDQLIYTVDEGAYSLTRKNKCKKKEKPKNNIEEEPKEVYTEVSKMLNVKDYNIIKYPFGYTVEDTKEDDTGKIVGIIRKVKPDIDDTKGIIDSLYKTCNNVV